MITSVLQPKALERPAGRLHLSSVWFGHPGQMHLTYPESDMNGRRDC
jgi:hypothetical protein